MCIGLSSPPSAPPVPPVPNIPPPVDPNEAETARTISRARERERRRAALAAGRSSTIRTSGQGLETPAASSTLKTVLGR